MDGNHKLVLLQRPIGADLVGSPAGFRANRDLTGMEHILIATNDVIIFHLFPSFRSVPVSMWSVTNALISSSLGF